MAEFKIIEGGTGAGKTYKTIKDLQGKGSKFAYLAAAIYALFFNCEDEPW